MVTTARLSVFTADFMLTGEPRRPLDDHSAQTAGVRLATPAAFLIARAVKIHLGTMRFSTWQISIQPFTRRRRCFIDAAPKIHEHRSTLPALLALVAILPTTGIGVLVAGFLPDANAIRGPLE